MQNDLEFEEMVRYDFVVGFGWILENPGFVFLGFWLICICWIRLANLTYNIV